MAIFFLVLLHHNNALNATDNATHLKLKLDNVFRPNISINESDGNINILPVL